MSALETQNFEKGRIKALQDERESIQKKTFTKWANAFLEKVRMEIRDLFTDLADGKILMKLLEIISGENLGKPNKGLLRVQKVENINRCLQFLATKVYFENIGAEDIVDGNPRLILGLIWTIILRFQIQEIFIDVDEEQEDSEKKSAKDALLLWCQRKTAGYPGVNITNFTTSWRSGLGFNALIHAHRPDLINYDRLDPAEHINNLNNAFNVADKQLGIPKILDAEDVDVNRPDEKIIVTYVASYYHYFAKMKSEMTGGKRIAKIIGMMRDVQKMQDDYEGLSSTLLAWVKDKIKSLNNRDFPNSLEGIQKELIQFKEYMTVEKPPKYREKGNVEVQYFNIQARLKANGQKQYIPPEGMLIHDIESAWLQLEKCEHGREVALKDELIRQERLEQLARRFLRKAAIRESWLTDMETILKEQIVCNNAAQTEAAVKKHEAISAEILARKDRFRALNNLATELVQGNYRAKDKVKQKDQEVMLRWKNLLDKLDSRKATLSGFNNLMAMFREIESIGEELKEVEPKVKADNYGKHLIDTQDLLQKHALQEAQLHSLSVRAGNLNRRSTQYAGQGYEAQHLDNKLDALNKDLARIQGISNKRKANLETAQLYYQFLDDAEVEERWAVEKIEEVKSTNLGKDLNAGLMLLKKHEALEAEIQGRWKRCEQICAVGQDLVNQGHPARSEIGSRIKSLMDKWNQLQDASAARKIRLEDAIEALQYYADADEAESWMKEKMPLVCSDDYGKDVASAQALLSRHNRLDQDIKAFNGEIKRLDELSVLMTKAASEHNISPAKFMPAENGEVEPQEAEDEEEEVIEVPTEIEVEETVEREVIQDVVESKKIPQVKVMYAYKGQGMTADKGEVMILLQKTNDDWWQVRKSDATEGFVPANYVKEVDPKVVQKTTKKPVLVPEKVKVKKTVMKKEVVKKKKKSNKLRRAPSVRSKGNLHYDKDNVETRQKGLSLQYSKLCKLSQARKISLEDAVKLFNFFSECNEFEAWMKDKEVILNSKDSLAEDMDAVKKKYENLLTSLAANKGRLDGINQLADSIIKSGSAQKTKVQQRQKEINDRWDKLNRLKMEKEKSLKGASSIEMYKSICDELAEWIKEKKMALAHDNVPSDLKSIQAQQRKHAQLERELIPMEEKMNRMDFLADTVRSAYPDEKGYVDQRQKDIKGQWGALKDQAKSRKEILGDANDQQRFHEDAKDLLNWASGVKRGLASAEKPHDIKSAEEMLKIHSEVLDDIKAHKDKLKATCDLGRDILSKNPNAKDVQEKVKKLEEEEKAINQLWAARKKDLQDAHNLQIFNREADQIDAVTSGHEAFLDFDDTGSTVDDVEGLSRRHADFEKKLRAQDDKVKALNDLADKLVAEKHPDSDRIDKRRKQVLERRQKVKDRAAERHKALLASQDFQKFKRDANELSDWIKEKMKTATDESYRDLSNLNAKLQKHAAFEAELKANNERLKGINKTGDTLIANKHPKSDEVKKIEDNLNKQWADLNHKAQDKGNKLRQASAQHTLNQALESAQAKLDEMQKSNSNTDLGSDLRGVKQLLKNHQNLENDLASLSETIQDIVKQGKQMADSGHFNSGDIKASVDEFNRRFERLKPAVALRKSKLEESLEYHQFLFDADSELQWIKEKLPAAASNDYGKNLVDAQKLHKKHQDLDREIQGHQGAIDKVTAEGERLVAAHHNNAKAIRDKNQEVQLAWDDLVKKSKNRKKNLDLSLQTQRYFSEVAEVDAWINDKMALVTSEDYGKDESAADKLLAKNNVLETDIQTYQNIVNGLAKESSRLFKSGYSDPQALRKAQDQLQENLNKLKRLAAERCTKLERSKRLYAYMREAEELESWINEQMQTASSEEYGQDFEHLELLRNKFDEFRRSVDARTERYNTCERLANYLIEDRGPHTKEVATRQETIRAKWNNLLEQIENRDQKLLGAGEIHRFNKDVEEALSRIQEKSSSIPEDVGRDYNSTLTFIKKHEAFENELVALEGQLQVLIDDSTRLQASYPGENAEQIAQLQSAVVDDWAELQAKSSNRGAKLLAAADLHKFFASARDLLGWAKEMEREMKMDHNVRDVNGADMLRQRHDEIAAEIEARQETFDSVINTGNGLIKNNHYAKDDVKAKVREVELAREQLKNTWLTRKDLYDQVYDFNVFLRDAELLNRVSATQEVYLNSPDFGDSVEQVEALTRKHQTFEKFLEPQKEKLKNVVDHGQRLVDSGHFQAKQIKQTTSELSERRKNIHDQSAVRKAKLEDSLLYQQFCRDENEAEHWIDEKLKVAYEDDFKDVTDLYDKMKKLQKHQAFHGEIVANTDRINGIKDVGEKLIKKNHHAQGEIKQSTTRLMSKWNELLKASANRGKGLEEAKDILEFMEQVDKVLLWIREKESLVHQNDLGRDYEHCLELQKKANDLESAGITVNEKRIKDINALADRLISQGRTDTMQVKEKRADMNHKWKDLQGALSSYKARLAEALEIHAFIRDVNDINDRIHEKAQLLSSDDLGKDLPAVEALQRKQEEIERDMTALQNQLEKIETQANKLSHTYKNRAQEIEQKKQEAEDNWEKLEDLSDSRKAKLAESYQLQKFLAEARELISWSNDMVNKMSAKELAKDVSEAENMLQMHNERKAEIEGRKSHFSTIRESGNNLINMKHFATEEIQKMIKQLDMTRLALLGAWEKRNNLLTQCHNLQIFKETAEQAEAWIGTKEAFLANEDVGNTLYGVESLMKKHENFEKTTKAQEDRIEELKQFASDLCSDHHYAADEINTRCQSVLNRRKRMWESSEARKKKLIESRNYQLFLRNLYEVSAWINEKLQVALDESYRDPTNLQAKLQKHSAFEAELSANRNRVDAVSEEGKGLVEAKHYAKLDIQKRLEELELSWQALIAASADKKDRLQDAYQALLFNRVVSDLSVWIDEVENQLMSEDHGKDLSSVNSLLNKHQQLEQDIASHKEKVTDILDAAQVFKEAKHFMNKELQASAREISERYNSLAEPCHIRRENLEEARRMYQFFRDVEDELSWIQDRKPLAESQDFGHSLSSVQNLMKKHQALESEIVAHEPLIETVASSAQQMIRGKHFAAPDIQTRLDSLHKNLSELKKKTSDRKNKLKDALEAQKFYTEVSELQQWMKEKLPQLTSSDLGKDEDSVLLLTKKLDALERDIDNFANSIGELAALCRTLTDRQHYDSENIRKTQADIEKQYSKLQDLATQRRKKLIDSRKLFEFYHEADVVESWISDRIVIAASEDYGQDLEHVEVLQQRFEDFLHDLSNNENRVTRVVSTAQTMIENNHFESNAIQAKSKAIEKQWAELKDISQARQDALGGAKEVHMYGRDADDTLEWIQEKDLIVSSEDYGHDLESSQALISRHEGLERDMAAISDQVENITKEAERLISTFPDAQEHIAAKHEEMVGAWNRLVEKAAHRKEKLAQAEQLQNYFNDYRELTAWISEMMAIITADELAHDLPGAEAMMTRYKEHRAEIDSRKDAFKKFHQTVESFISQGHFLSEEIKEKIKQLDQSLEGLIRTMEHRRSLHEKNLEAQRLRHEIEQIEAWMNLREPLIKGAKFGESIPEVEELIRRHADFEKTVDAQGDRVNNLCKDKVDRAVKQQKLLEQKQQVEDEARREKDRLDELRKREQERILEAQNNERRREDEQRKAKEFLLRRQKSENDEDRRNEDKLDKSTVKKIIGRSQSIKIATRPEGTKTDVQRAVSFRTRNEMPSTTPISLQKAANFHQESIEDQPSSPELETKPAWAKQSPPSSPEASKKFVSDKQSPSLSPVAAKRQNMTLPSAPSASSRLSEITLPSPGDNVSLNEDDETSAPELPNAPPPPPTQPQPVPQAISPTPLSPSFQKKGNLSPPLSPTEITTKRSDIMKEESKKSKRTASFNIRRRTRSFKDKYKLPDNLPPAEIEGMVERKHELQSGGKKATIRSWKNFYTVLYGQLLCFFKDKEAYADGVAAAPPVNIHRSINEIASDYTKKQNVLRLKLQDGAEYLLEFANSEMMSSWHTKIQHFADLDPSEQFSRSANHGQETPPRDSSPPPPSHPPPPETPASKPTIPPKPLPRSIEPKMESSKAHVHELEPIHSRTPSLPSNNSEEDDYQLQLHTENDHSHDRDSSFDEDIQLRGHPGGATLGRPDSSHQQDEKHEKEKRKSGVFGFLKKKKDKEHKKDKSTHV
ncbi:spectrin beta chain, non-erythrocytic 2-like isoform X3 [Biomphalaria glabrata]|uniref:Spectrin beta chain, non-erythrocytic 2-like isoform X3 n=1 Tax=Biomphalaria glabrata TaxID=6526 RepID=A0A9W3A0P3_BIOGL|nr:spectrin beta chain, non-erythrocytic 2-like isoform X3 [Biomphalaria glabrata]